MMATTRTADGALVTIRTARKRHWCGKGRHAIEPGEVYEDWRVPPRRGGNESSSWWRGKCHPDDAGQPYGSACDVIDAYREHAARAVLGEHARERRAAA